MASCIDFTLTCSTVIAVGTLTLQGELSVNNAIVASSTDDVLGMAMVTTTEGISWVLHWHELAAVRLGSCHTSTIRGLSLASCGSFFATSGDDGSVRVWNGQTPEQIMQFQVADERLAATCVSLSPGQSLLALFCFKKWFAAFIFK